MNSVSSQGAEAALFDRTGRRRYLNAVERDTFLRAIESERDMFRRTFGLTLFYTGCRISEALLLTQGRVDLRAQALVFETLKRRRRGHFRSVPIPEALAKSFGQILAGDKSSERIWDYSRTTAFRFIKERMEQAGIAGPMACPKGLRHGFAIACIAQNIPLTTVQKWLGHARLETSAIYLDVSGEDERELAKRLWKLN